MNALPQAAREALEAAMKGYEYQSDFARKYVAQGREEGLRVAPIEMAREKLGGLSPVEEGRLAAIDGVVELTRLLLAFGRARDLVEARTVIDSLG